jgi:predicted dienelactone hydrolase
MAKHDVAVILTQWTDPARDRTVPVKIYHPQNGAGPFPIIIFSHGLGGSRDTYEYVGRGWASHGYIVAHPQHLGSDSAIWQTDAAASRQSLQKILFNPENSINRTQDVTFAIDQIIHSEGDTAPLRGKIDASAIGVSGHSFGAMTALQCAEHDKRVKAIVAMSTPIPPEVKAQATDEFAKIKVPCLHLTGTRDSGMTAPTPPEYRRIPFDQMEKADQYLITFEGGDHMVFTGRRVLDHKLPNDDLFHDLILQSTTAFWDAYLKGDAGAKNWLASGPFQVELGTHGVFEKKQIVP